MVTTTLWDKSETSDPNQEPEEVDIDEEDVEEVDDDDKEEEEESAFETEVEEQPKTTKAKKGENSFQIFRIERNNLGETEFNRQKHLLQQGNLLMKLFNKRSDYNMEGLEQVKEHLGEYSSIKERFQQLTIEFLNRLGSLIDNNPRVDEAIAEAKTLKSSPVSNGVRKKLAVAMDILKKVEDSGIELNSEQKAILGL